MAEASEEVSEQAGHAEPANRVHRERERIVNLTQTAMTLQAVASGEEIEVENSIL